MDVPGYESRVEGSAMKTRTPAANRRHLGRPFKSRSTTGALRQALYDTVTVAEQD